jgi:uncharacterized protein with WD repeat
MNEALVRIIKDRDYHMRQLEENLRKIELSKENIQVLEECNIKEMKLIEEYNRIIQLIEKA